MTKERIIKENIARLWNSEYKTYDSSFAHGIKSEDEKAEWLRLLDGLIEKKPSLVLDVGTGTGFNSLLLAELGHEIKGIDISENMLSVAKQKAEKAGFTNVIFAIGDAENTGEPSSYYDVVINRHLMWTLPHPENALKDWLRVLKPGGKLIILEGNWFYSSASDKISVFLGRCLISIQEKRNAFSNKGNYDTQTKKELPMIKSQNARRLAQIVADAGFSVQVKQLTDVDQAERKAMPLGYRLLNPYKRIAVIGKKRQ